MSFELIVGWLHSNSTYPVYKHSPLDPILTIRTKLERFLILCVTKQLESFAANFWPGIVKQCLFLLSGWNMKFSHIIGLYQFLLACYNHGYKDCDLKKPLGLLVVFMSVYCPVSYRNILKKKQKYQSLGPVTVSPNHSVLWNEFVDVKERTF